MAAAPESTRAESTQAGSTPTHSTPTHSTPTDSTHAGSPDPTAPAQPRDLAHLHAARAHSFNAAAAQYAAHRPSYPEALFDAVEELSGRPLAGARVADVGAGTGIATALLARRGADVLAVEPGAGMAAELRRALPEVPLVRGDGNALPLADASVDLLTYAQSWHWTDPARAVPEARRVLRPGGALALWWNTSAVDVPWISDQSARIARHFGIEDAQVKKGSFDTGAADPTGSLRFAHRRVRWSRRVPVDTHLANIGSHSVFLVHGASSAQAFLTAERAHLLTVFPDGVVEETYEVHLLLARTTA
ncbi:class I SAM-dependent methyltransferase [Streptomyces sp. NPDC014801]|uniref:class I SAM-dependent methyltransferase n=1 Tax=Streptomyces sp. NPDC014801 TaxID=3364916 RepID=UPI0036FF9D39